MTGDSKGGAASTSAAAGTVGARGAARLAAVQALYQIDATQGDAETVLEEFLTHRLGREVDGDNYVAADEIFFADIVRGVVERRPALDEAIGGALKEGWKVGRLERILLAILQAGAYELMARPDVPGRVIINEYLNLAHAFFTGDEPGFVNGVLDRLGRDLRPGAG